MNKIYLFLLFITLIIINKKFILTFLIFLIQGLYCKYIINFNNKKPVQQNFKKGLVKINKISWNNKNVIETINSYFKTSIPLIVKDMPKDYFEKLETINDEINDEKDYLKENVFIKNRILPRNLGKLGSFINKDLKKNILYIAKLTGSYKNTYAHIDYVPSYTFYYLKKGKKKIILIPIKYSDKYIVKGDDCVYDKDSMHKENWYKKYPSYYKFNLKEGEVLFFNNTSCLHKFENRKISKAFLMRISNEYTLDSVLKCQLWNWKWAKYSYKLVFEKTERDATVMDLKNE